MTVSELIATLFTFPPGATVLCLGVEADGETVVVQKVAEVQKVLCNEGTVEHVTRGPVDVCFGEDDVDEPCSRHVHWDNAVFISQDVPEEWLEGGRR